jgi:hypothetical protein
MLNWLNEFNDDFNKNRGENPEYKFAQCLRFAQREGKRFDLDMSEHTGWGVIPFDENYFAEYEYTLTSEGVNFKTLYYDTR